MSRALLSGCLVLGAAAAVLHVRARVLPVGRASTVAELAPPPAQARPYGSGPDLPRDRVAVPQPPGGATRTVGAGQDLQDALDAARPGDVILLEPGVTYRGPFTLRDKPGEEWITVRTRVADGILPPRGTRIDPSHAPLMATIEAESGSALTAAPGAHHYLLIGLEIRPRPGAFLHNLVALGGDETSLRDLPHHIVFDRCYLHGDPQVGGRRGIALNGRDVAVVDSYLADFKEQGADSQAIAGWNGPGPFAIVNDYLEAAGENVMFGGADPAITNLVPSDIEIRGNHFAKPLAWKAGEPGYQGTAWTVKNLFELKNARRVLVEGNVFENNWVQAQSGFAILFTPRNQDGGAPWSTVEDVTFASNIVRHSASAVNILGQDDLRPSQSTRRIVIRNNLFEDIGDERWGGGGRLFQVVAGAIDVVIDHNTAVQTGNIITTERGPHPGFVFRNNIAPHNAYGIVGTGTSPGQPTLAAYFPGAVVSRNVVVAGEPALHPDGNFFPPSMAAVGFVDLRGGDYRLAGASPYRRAGTDGKDVGVDFDELRAAGPSGLAAAGPGRSGPASALEMRGGK